MSLTRQRLQLLLSQNLGLLYNLGTDRTEITISKNLSVVVCLVVAVKKFLAVFVPLFWISVFMHATIYKNKA
jgi:hypothetical protein